MDFRRVETRWRVYALVLQVVVHAVMDIVRSSTDPPVTVGSKKWSRGAGMWAICSPYSNPLVLAGVGIPDDLSSGPMDCGANRTGRDLAVPQVMNMTRGKMSEMNCTVADLRDVQLPVRPAKFLLCAETSNDLRPLYYVWSQDRWQYVKYQAPKGYNWYRMDRTLEGWDLGYTSTLRDTFTLSPLWEYPPVMDWSGCCEMKHFSTTANQVSMLEISIENELVTEIKKQGALPQLYTVLANLGGFVSLLTTVFVLVFVKKYSDSGVAKIYEARTFVGEKIAESIGAKGPGARTDEEMPTPLQLPQGMFQGIDRE